MAVDAAGNEVTEPTADEKAALEAKAAEDAAKIKADEEAKRQAGPAPAIDADAVSKVIADRVAAALVEQAGTTEPVVTPVATEMNPLHQTIDQRVQPALHQADIASLDAKDCALFYNTTPDAREYSKDLEAAADNMKKQGTPFTRKSLWAFFRGEHQDEFFEKREKQKAKETEDAKHAQTIDGGGRPIASESVELDSITPDANTDDKLNKALDNAQF